MQRFYYNGFAVLLNAHPQALNPMPFRKKGSHFQRLGTAFQHEGSHVLLQYDERFTCREAWHRISARRFACSAAFLTDGSDVGHQGTYFRSEGTHFRSGHAPCFIEGSWCTLPWHGRETCPKPFKTVRFRLWLRQPAILRPQSSLCILPLHQMLPF